MKRKLMWVGVMLGIFSLGVLAASSLEDWFCAAGTVLYVASADEGAADGLRREDAALYTRPAFWEKVNTLLKEGPVTVSFADGLYSSTLSLSRLGHDKHRLTLTGQSPDGVIFNGEGTVLFELKGCRNMVVESFNFTGEAPAYSFRITKYCPPEFYEQFNEENKLTAAAIKAADGTVSKNIMVRNCNWYDMNKLLYGATGVAYGSYHITFENCTFKRIGSSTYAHMIYNAYDVDYVSVLNCHFEDCGGAYVRFRDRSDYGVVAGCTFVSTHTYENKSSKEDVFVEIQVFNDVDPGDESFGHDFVITGNTFRFNREAPPLRIGVRFDHSGFTPVDWNYLMTAAEGAILEAGNASAQRELLKKNYGIDFDHVVVKENVWENETSKIQFSSKPEYESISQAWEGSVNISEIVFGVPGVGSP